MRLLCGTILLLLIWPLAIAVDIVSFCLILGLIACMCDNRPPFGIAAAMRLTELIYR